MKIKLVVAQVHAESVWPEGSELDVESSTGTRWVADGVAESLDITDVVSGPAEQDQGTPVEVATPVVDTSAVSVETDNGSGQETTTEQENQPETGAL